MNDVLLKSLLSEPSECEWLEFKDSFYEPHVIGEYLSALANSACLANHDKGYLIFGVEDATHEIVGTSFRPSSKKHKKQPLEFWLNQLLSPRVGFAVDEMDVDGKLIVGFEVNPAAGEPVKFDGDAYVRVNSCKTKLKHHPELQRRIWTKGATDWTARAVPGASVNDLDPDAIEKARREYKIKHGNANFKDEIDDWDAKTFLNKSRLAVRGKLTHSAILLLGKPESVHFIQPSVANISWILRDHDNLEIDYAHFGPPFIINVDLILEKIRNLTLRALPDGTLFPIEISQYDPWVMREALHNCIAHQDYGMCSRISVVESPDSLLFVNAGAFVPGSIENVLRQDAPQRYYPNRHLTDAMVNLNMIDTIGSGIKRMFITQKKRFMPMPDYNLSRHDEVKLSLAGRILDVNYTRLLISESGNLPLDLAILLDKVQRGKDLPNDELKKLRVKKLVEGRKPNIFVASHVAKLAKNEAQYIKNRAFNDEHYKKLILSYIDEYGQATRQDVRNLLFDKLPDVLDEEQKNNKVKNLLGQLSRKEKRIRSKGKTNNAVWVRR